MGKKSHKKRKGIVYSTNPDFEYRYQEPEEQDTPDKDDQRLRVRIEKKGRGGKTVTLVSGFAGSTEDRKALAKKLKNHCGAGGSGKEEEILIQGDNRDKVIRFLRKEGYGDVK